MSNPLRLRRAAILAAAGIVSAALLAACSSSPTTRGTSTAAAGPASTVTVVPARHVTSPSSTPTPTPEPKPKPNPCGGNVHRQLVRVSLRAQHLWMCDRARLVRDTPITSGMTGADTATPTGHYTIQGRDRNSVLTLNTGKQYDVKYWIPFNAPLFGFHDSSWQRFPYGSPEYRTDGSHGCVHMPLKAIAFLYNWVEIGAAVTIA